MMLSAVPSPSAFLAYVSDPSTVLIGPFLEFKEYSEFVHGEGPHAEYKKPPFLGTSL